MPEKELEILKLIRKTSRKDLIPQISLTCCYEK